MCASVNIPENIPVCACWLRMAGRAPGAFFVGSFLLLRRALKFFEVLMATAGTFSLAADLLRVGDSKSLTFLSRAWVLFSISPRPK